MELVHQPREFTVTTTFAPFNQTANFARCPRNRYENATGSVRCAGRITDATCEFGHDVCTAGSDEGYCSCTRCLAYYDEQARQEQEAERGYERSLEVNERQAWETDQEARYEAWLFGK